MVCPLCPTAGFIGGIAGGYLDVNPPASFGGRCLSVLTTASLVSLTILALKKIFDVSLCYGTGFTPANISVVLAKTLLMGVVYSIAVNFLLNRYVLANAPVDIQLPTAPVEEPPYCCRNK